MNLSQDIALDIDAKASGGGVDVRATAFQGDSTKNTASGPINGGGPALAIRTSGGSITLRQP